jgi:hypothetical protein
MTAEISVTYTGVDFAEMDASVIRELRLEAPILAADLTLMVQDKTPVLIGALRSDIHGIPNLDENTLALIYPTGVEQLLTWGREYVKYQEGPPMGVTTYTNPPRQMFETTATTDGLAYTEAWAEQAILTGIALTPVISFGGGAYGYA